MLIGYMRPFHDDLSCKEQLQTLSKFNLDLIIKESHSSSKRRTELEMMIQDLQKDDVIFISKLYIIADSSRHLVDLLEEIKSKGAFLRSLSEEIDTNKSGYSFYEIVKHLVDFQSDVISEKTKLGLHEAKEKGITTGRPRKPDLNVQRAIEMYKTKQYSLAQIKDATGISKSTLYRYLES